MENERIVRSFRQYFNENPERSGKMLALFNRAMSTIGNSDAPEIKVLPFLCQLWEARPRTCIEEDLICAVLWQRIIQNKLIYTIQETPQCYADDDIKKNDELVKSYIPQDWNPKVIDAQFWGGTQGADGFIQFSAPPLNKQTKFPLEIGYIRPSQFYYHIFYRNCVARLPYDSDFIIYFEDTEMHQTA